ncbi:glycosyltransferase family 4 protein [Pedobacter metabolipauper]|uniref:Glycosyltransferase involved in cell wall biosynthesis n=1 Tax=Pedobacter metabolipauper TaxID=425513 RepID=A0A4R6SWU7_9SPHI|nr:glycosyltransferase family 4 protein [Pedobacter metabolipauper]TDQ09911.1 glycosyltransferase involved in cell wall biosynthesis [Pedobacter metabolipauper]
MNIAFILPSLLNHGPILVAKDLIEELLKNGHSCKVYYFDKETELHFPCPVERISFFKKISFNHYDIIHSHLFRPDVYCAFHRSAIGPGTRLITTVHTDIFRDLRSAYGFLKGVVAPYIWKRAWKKMDTIVVLSQVAKDNYNKIGLTDKLAIINNGRNVPESYEAVPQSDLDTILKFRSGYTLLGTVSIVDKRKGLEQVLLVLRDNPAYAFLVVGDGIERQNLEKLAEDYGVANRLLMLGRRPQGFRYIPLFDLFLIPSRSEGMPLALLEAAALKTAAVCSDIPVFKEIFRDTEVSFFHLDSTASLQAACTYGLANKAALEQNAYARYLKEYNVAGMAAHYIQLYQSTN